MSFVFLKNLCINFIYTVTKHVLPTLSQVMCDVCAKINCSVTY